MSGYQPLDLRSLCNAGIDLYQSGSQPPTGLLTLRGLPFLIGGNSPDQKSCYVNLGMAHEPLSISVGSTAFHILFAHALLDSRVLEGETIGTVVAHYTVRYANGEELRIPIRERFEIGAIPMWWSAFPFL